MKTVLIVDDDADDREFFCEAAAQVSATVQCIASTGGVEALTMLQDSPEFIPDYIFLDLNMPRMNGKQCLVELKKMPRLQQVPVVIYTTSKITEELKVAKKLGAVHFITKPCRFADLCTAIAHVFDNAWEKVDEFSLKPG